MILRSIGCPFVDWPLARATAEQWTEATVTWEREAIVFTFDAPRLLAADAAVISEQAVETIEKSVRTHAFVRRGP